MIRQIAPQLFTRDMAATLDAYLFVADVDALHAEYSARGVDVMRALGDTPWGSREFVVKDCDGRLLAFGADRD